MATLTSPVELPTSRRSYQLPPNTDNDISNPQWIPVLQKNEPTPSPASQEKEVSPYSGASFSPMPTYTSDLAPPKSKPSSLHSYSRSSLAPESVELEAASPPPPMPLPPLPSMPTASRQMNFELPATRPTSRYFENNHQPTISGDVNSTDTETTVDMSRSESNAGTASTSDDATSVVQAPATVKEETPSLYPRSTRSSYSSSKRYTIAPPTSKFSRQPIPPLPVRGTSLAQPQADRSAANVPSSKTTPAHSRTQTPAESPKLTASNIQPTPLKPSRSTTSKKGYSLHPTPSTASLASHSSSDNSAIIAIPTSIEETHRPMHQARKSTQSVRSQHTQLERKDSNIPLPPRIPAPEINRESLASQESNQIPKKPESALLAPQPRPGPSSGISSFMTANDTVIFRRFDEVHVQLLLCLQDEITQLERDLMKLESASLTRTDRDIERGRVMRELRKIVAEYGKYI